MLKQNIAKDQFIILTESYYTDSYGESVKFQEVVFYKSKEEFELMIEYLTRNQKPFKAGTFNEVTITTTVDIKYA